MTDVLDLGLEITKKHYPDRYEDVLARAQILVDTLKERAGEGLDCESYSTKCRDCKHVAAGYVPEHMACIFSLVSEELFYGDLPKREESK